jgi:hypothetical protein
MGFLARAAVAAVLVIVACAATGQDKAQAQQQQQHSSGNNVIIDDSTSVVLAAVRKQLMSKIHHEKLKKCHYFPIHSRVDFYDGKWDQYINGGADNNGNTGINRGINGPQRVGTSLAGRQTEALSALSTLAYRPVHFYSPCMSTYNLGNSLGNYISEIFCAVDAGVHLVIGTKTWDHPHMPFEYKGELVIMCFV